MRWPCHQGYPHNFKTLVALSNLYAANGFRRLAAGALERGLLAAPTEEDRTALVVEHMGEETLVYDLESHQAHRLDATAAAVWRRCDGKASPEDIATAIAERGTHLDEREVEATLVALAGAGLLVGVVASQKRGSPVSRRRAAAALAAGVVTTILAPTVAQAVSTTCIACNKCVPGTDDTKPCGSSPCTTCTCVAGECRRISDSQLCTAC